MKRKTGFTLAAVSIILMLFTVSCSMFGGDDDDDDDDANGVVITLKEAAGFYSITFDITADTCGFGGDAGPASIIIKEVDSKPAMYFDTNMYVIGEISDNKFKIDAYQMTMHDFTQEMQEQCDDPASCTVYDCKQVMEVAGIYSLTGDSISGKGSMTQKLIGPKCTDFLNWLTAEGHAEQPSADPCTVKSNISGTKTSDSTDVSLLSDEDCSQDDNCNDSCDNDPDCDNNCTCDSGDCCASDCAQPDPDCGGSCSCGHDDCCADGCANGDVDCATECACGEDFYCDPSCQSDPDCGSGSDCELILENKCSTVSDVWRVSCCVPSEPSSGGDSCNHVSNISANSSESFGMVPEGENIYFTVRDESLDFAKAVSETVSCGGGTMTIVVCE